MILGWRGPREREEVVIVILGEEPQGKFFFIIIMNLLLKFTVFLRFLKTHW